MSIEHKTAIADFGLGQIREDSIPGRASRILAEIATMARRSIVAEYRRHRTERQLGALSDSILKDIGVHRSQVDHVARSLSRDGRWRARPGR